MSYVAPQYPSTPPAKGGKPWLLIVGAVLAIIAVALCCVGGFMTVGSGQDLANSPEYTGSHTVTLQEGDTRAVWSSDESASCSVTGPSGSVSDASGSTQTTSWGEEQYHRVFAIEADQAGDYTINCASPFRVGDSLSTGGFIGMGVGAGLGCIAVVLMGIGLVLWLTRRKRA